MVWLDMSTRTMTFGPSACRVVGPTPSASAISAAGGSVIANSSGMSPGGSDGLIGTLSKLGPSIVAAWACGALAKQTDNPNRVKTRYMTSPVKVPSSIACKR